MPMYFACVHLSIPVFSSFYRFHFLFQRTPWSPRRSLTKRKRASFMVLLVAIISIIAYVGVTTSYAFYLVTAERSKYLTMINSILSTNRQNLLSVAVSTNFIIYSKYCSNFQSVILKHWNQCLERCGYQQPPGEQGSLTPSTGPSAKYGSTTPRNMSGSSAKQ